jgi:hypothetical protein|tara:strand:- start:18037 stop:18345 length:309 start_codon:yes stop_codon:yes gene_type:complete
MKAHYQIAKYAIKTMGYSISVDDGDPDGEFVLERSTNIKAVVEACEGVDESHMFFFDKDGAKQSWAFIVLGNDGGDEVSDYGVIDWIDAFFNTPIMSESYHG